jgi:glycosyltransferase involved in cell wall biosynthesis
MAKEALTSPYPLDQEMSASGGRSEGTAGLSVYFDGVFKGDYSLAIVNRNLAKALIEAGVDLNCYTRDAGWQTDSLLKDVPEVRKRMLSEPPTRSFDVHIRNTWPPATHDMVGAFNAYACFAWEESEFPANLVERFNRDLDLVMVASTFARRALIDSGVRIPIEIVGEGSDHVLNVVLPSRQNTSPCPRFLHVSSGFLRKGVDCLIRAYCDSFTVDDNVELVIKTFANPNNVIPALVGDLGSSGTRPAIRMIEATYSYSELLSLYRTATAVVAPSRGEGFGLPLAEAMALEVPVITTNYSGQVDFCRPDTSWLVDYTLAASKAHVSSSFSLWADPDIAHLGRQMRAVLKETGEVAKRSARAKAFVDHHLTWAKTAKRTLFSISKHLPRKSRLVVREPSAACGIAIDVVTSWGRSCGIATYASHLYRGTSLSLHVSAIFAQKHGTALPDEGADDAKVSRIWGDDYQSMQALANRLERGTGDAVWIQHHPGHFSTPDMLMLAEGIAKSRYKTRAITIHSVAEAARGGSLSWCSHFDIAFVHSAEDAEALSRAGHQNPIVIPHGFLPVCSVERLPEKCTFDIGSFGFLTPHKNVDLLVRAFALARCFAPELRLHLFNCALANDSSLSTQAIVENLIRHCGLDGVVRRHYEFIPEHRLITDLSRCDLFAFPYGKTTETATGAARIALSANKPILCSQSAVLRDLHPVSHVLKDLSIDCLAEALISLSQSKELLSLYDHQRTEILHHHTYERVATRYLGHIMRSLEKRRDYRHAA